MDNLKDKNITISRRQDSKAIFLLNGKDTYKNGIRNASFISFNIFKQQVIEM
jgi:hypothetical protein